MAAESAPREMNKWENILHDPNIQFPGESSEYRRARNQLLESEDELRRLTEQVAAQRRALPVGGLLKEDYVFESADDGSEVRFSELFAPGKDTLVIYNMMFPRWSEDSRKGAARGKTALLPLAEQPCPSCTSFVDGLDGPALHLAARINLAVVAKTDPARLSTYGQERGWRNLRLLSSRNNTFGRDYHGETPEGEQLPVLNVFSRDEDGIHHRWASELQFTAADTTAMAPVWSLLGLLDLTPDGRGSMADYPALQYDE
ncbi:DUF899 family protein [Streptomyces sp. NPDC050743]|uniref:DUF899 family protein n=1 Tax=Streptomyces sp. NPDC050743 TaxID=3365634 RepID=UPI0037A9B030